ncbi:MAG: hypothetical protein LBE37_14245 [Sphingobacterium sp.]|jgi:hypothetical protein|nr:hypothetical protein [Sphingobacterium sp.]
MKKHIFLVTFVLTFLGLSSSNAQMAAAVRITPTVEDKLEVSVERDSLWSLMIDYSMVSQLSEGYVVSIENKDDIAPILREVKLKNGSIREELLTQFEQQNRFYVSRFKDSSLPKGVKSVQIAVFAREKKEGGSQIVWDVLIEGDKEAKESLKQQMTAEVQAYKAGFAKYLSGAAKAVPMMQ